MVVFYACPARISADILSLIHLSSELTTMARFQHQCRCGDPEEEYENFGSQAGDGIGSAAARERVAAMVGESDRRMSAWTIRFSRTYQDMHCVGSKHECED